MIQYFRLSFLKNHFILFFLKTLQKKVKKKIWKNIFKSHSNYRIYTIRKVKSILKQRHSLNYYEYTRLLCILYKQAQHELKGINYSFWIKKIEPALPPVITEQLDTTSISFFIINTDNKTIDNLPVRKTYSSIRKQNHKNSHITLLHHFSDEQKEAIDNSFDMDINVLNIEKKTDFKTIILPTIEQYLSPYICIIPAGTELSSIATQKILSTFKNTSADIVYCDNDFLDHTGKRHSPNFKPDWNLDYFYNYNYISNTLVMKYRLLASLEHNSTDINHDHLYHTLLNNKDKLKQLNIQHIPEVLFHLPEITNHQEHHHYNRLSTPLVSIIIPTRDEATLLEQCINSLLDKTTYPNFEILIIDNQSKEQGTLDYLQELKANTRISILQYPHSFNYSAINNFAVQHARGSVLAFVNNDIECINPEWLTEMVSHACRPDIGCVGAKLYYPDGTIQHGGVILGLHGTASHAHKGFAGDSSGYFERLSVVHNVSAVTAACMVMRKELFIEVGGFDEINLTVAYNDVDLCLKVLELGYRNLWTPFAELIHYESKSRGRKHTKETRSRLDQEEGFMHKKWIKYLENDPAYNINLTLIREDFSLGNSRKMEPAFNESTP